MAQSINVLWSNSFENPMQLPLLCEKTEALAIVEYCKERNFKFCIFDF